MYTESLIIAFTPTVAFVGAALSYYGFTERGDLDPVPEVVRGGTVDEPWGIPQAVRKHVLPGSVLMQLPHDHALDGKTQEHDIIYVERTNDEAIPRR